MAMQEDENNNFNKIPTNKLIKEFSEALPRGYKLLFQRKFMLLLFPAEK